MQIVIDIPEEMYKNIQSRDWENGGRWFSEEWKAIHNGTPLPKGHGRLIDADAYIDKYEEFWWLDDISVDEFNAITPTIIEADRSKEK